MPASTTDDILTLTRPRAYALRHLRSIVTRQDAIEARAWLRSKGEPGFGLSTFYEWVKGKAEPTWPMLRALAYVRGYRMVMVKRTDVA